MNSKLFINDFDENDNPIYIVFTKIKKKLVKLISGKFDFRNDWCTITGFSNLALTDEGFEASMEALQTADWDCVNPLYCRKELRKLVKQYNKQHYGKTDPYEKINNLNRKKHEKN